MKIIKLSLIFLLLAVYCIHADYEIRWQVIGNGAAYSRAEDTVMNGTVGQPVIGITNASVYSASQGFWTGIDSIVATVETSGNEYVDIRLWPVPASEQINIEFQNENYSKVSADILDLNGKKVGIIPQSGNSGGKTKLFWNFSEKNIASGIYICKILLSNKSQFEILTVKFIIKNK